MLPSSSPSPREMPAPSSPHVRHHPPFGIPNLSLMRVLLAAGRITPLYTVDHKGSRKQDGAQKKYYGSYLIKLRRR